MAKIISRVKKEGEKMEYVIVGLGNPGRRYEQTRHNIGFMALQTLAGRLEIELAHKSFDSLWGKGAVGDQKVLLAEPQTYMNLSGTAVRQLQSFFKTDISNLIVIHDDLDLPFESVRLKAGGGPPGIKDWHLFKITWELQNLRGCDWVSANRLTKPGLRVMCWSPFVRKNAMSYRSFWTRPALQFLKSF